MVLAGMMLTHVVSQIGTARTMIYNELALSDFVANPKEAHIHGFGALLLDIVVGDAGGSGIVSDHWSRSLVMAEFFEGISFRDGFLAIDEKAGQFSFSSTG